MDVQQRDRNPGFRRRIVLQPSDHAIWVGLEDDYHRMAIILRHREGMVEAIDVDMERVPWTTCPGAPQVLRETFVGYPLHDVAARGMKRMNCTHLHDLTVLGAAHWADARETVYDILVADPVDGFVSAEIRRNGEQVLMFEHRHDTMISPAETAGLHVNKLRDWIGTLTPDLAEAARLLQWGTILAHGRAASPAGRSDASRWPANCYTFQPGRREHTRHVGTYVDFSAGGRQPLEPISGKPDEA